MGADSDMASTAAVPIMALATAAQAYAWTSYVTWAVGAGYTTAHTWQQAVLALLVFMVPGAVTALLSAVVLDAWYLPALVRTGWATPTQHNTIQLPSRQVALVNVAAALMAELWPCMGAAWSAQHIPFNLMFCPLRAWWMLVCVLLLHDAYYYAVHRLLHRSRWLYKAVHADHHCHDVLLQARTGLFISKAEAVVLIGLFYGAVAVFMPFWVPINSPLEQLLVFNTSVHVAIIGHSGVKFNQPLALLAINPYLAAILITGTAQSPQDHLVHHLQPSKNMSLTFRHWDDWGGTAAHVPGRASSSPLLIAYNLAFYYCLSHVLSLLATSAAAWAMLGAGALLLALLPAPCGGPLWLRRLRVWDVLRGAYGISLDASACAVAADAEPAGAAAGVQGGLDGRQRYIFCYHPHGVLARGFWWTWMLQGQESPVAAAGLRVQLGVHRLLLSIPLVKQVLGLLGCCPVDRHSLTMVLSEEAPTSVALCPGGWAEGRLASSTRTTSSSDPPRAPVSAVSHPGVTASPPKGHNAGGGADPGSQGAPAASRQVVKVLLAQRKGFIKLSLDTGAHLVPVLGIGEERVGSNLLMALLLPAKRVPIKVVFGAPIDPSNYVTDALAAATPASLDDTAPIKDQSKFSNGVDYPTGCQKNSSDGCKATSRLHRHYIAALHHLAEQHGVTLEVC